MTYLWKLLSEHQILLSFAISTMAVLGNWMYTAINNTQIQMRLDKADARAVHRHIDSFTVGAADFRDIAYAYENEAKEQRRHTELLIDCVKRNDCQRYPELLKVREKPNIPAVRTGYEKIQSLLQKANGEEE